MQSEKLVSRLYSIYGLFLFCMDMTAPDSQQYLKKASAFENRLDLLYISTFILN